MPDPSATALGALAPIFGLILLGTLLRRQHFLAEEFWAPAAKLTYFLLLPALLVDHLASAPLRELQVSVMAAVLSLALLFVALMLILLRRQITHDARAFTSVFQGAIRHNTYVGLAVVAAVAGGSGVAYAAVALPVMVILVNLLSVSVLTRYASMRRFSWRNIIGSIIANPLIAASAIGVALSLSGIVLPSSIGRMVAALGQASLPLGLLLVGAGLDIATIGRRLRLMLIAAVIKLLILPAIVLGLAALLQLEGVGASVAVLFAALPTAPSAYVLAEQMEGDAPLMASILTVQTLLAAPTLTLWLIWAGVA